MVHKFWFLILNGFHLQGFFFFIEDVFVWIEDHRLLNLEY